MLSQISMTGNLTTASMVAAGGGSAGSTGPGGGPSGSGGAPLGPGGGPLGPMGGPSGPVGGSSGPESGPAGSGGGTAGAKGAGQEPLIGHVIKCACDSVDQHRCLPGLDYCLTNYTCFATLQSDDDDDGADVMTLGCLSDRESADLNCHVGSHPALSIKCRGGMDFCNRRLVPAYLGTPTDATRRGAAAGQSSLGVEPLQQSLYGATALILVLIVFVLAAWRLLHCRHKQRLAALKARHQRALLQLGRDELRVDSIGGSTYKALYEQSLSSSSSSGGSGSGLPLLTPPRPVSLTSSHPRNAAHFAPFYAPPNPHSLHSPDKVLYSVPQLARDYALPHSPPPLAPYYDRDAAPPPGPSHRVTTCKGYSDAAAAEHSGSFRNVDAEHSGSFRNVDAEHSGSFRNVDAEHSGVFRSVCATEHCGIARHVHLVQLLHRGRYGNVWRGIHRGDPVAVRIYAPSHASLWQRQLSLYTSLALRHDNLLRFVGADVIDNSAGQSNSRGEVSRKVNGETDDSLRFWLVTRFHADGCLGDRLRARPVATVAELLRLLGSAARGLAYLHAFSPPALSTSPFPSSFLSPSSFRTPTEFASVVNKDDKFFVKKFPSDAGNFCGAPNVVPTSGNSDGSWSPPPKKETVFSTMTSSTMTSSGIPMTTRGSPAPHKSAVAHGDVTSRNFFVAADGRCCIDGLGHAVAYSSCGVQGNGVCNPLSSFGGVGGDVRYAAPEVLKRVGERGEIGFEGLLAADVYAFGLVAWEAARRCLVNGECHDYELPYFDAVPNNPSAECMKRVVCSERQRPIASPHWAQNETLRALHQLMRECWRENSIARPSMQRVCRTLDRLQATLCVNERDADASSEKT